MNIQSNPCHVASQTSSHLPIPDRVTQPHLWLDLPTQTQRQIAQIFALLLLRMRPTRAPMRADRHVENIE
jgi:hypothetical protein